MKRVDNCITKKSGWPLQGHMTASNWNWFIINNKFLQLENQIFHRTNRLKPNWTTSNVGGENLKNDRLKMFLIQFFEFLGYKKRDLANSLPKLLAVILTAIQLNPVQWSEFNQPYF